METYMPKNSINISDENTDTLIQELETLKKENARLRKNNETYKLKYIALIEKLGNLKNIINESITL
jgi:parvulin-like peptidyl-prolyl isomerase